MLFRVNGGSVAEKSCLACAMGAGVAALPSNWFRFARAVELMVPGAFFLFFDDAVILCFAC